MGPVARPALSPPRSLSLLPGAGDKPSSSSSSSSSSSKPVIPPLVVGACVMLAALQARHLWQERGTAGGAAPVARGGEGRGAA